MNSCNGAPVDEGTDVHDVASLSGSCDNGSLVTTSFFMSKRWFLLVFNSRAERFFLKFLLFAITNEQFICVWVNKQ